MRRLFIIAAMTALAVGCTTAQSGGGSSREEQSVRVETIHIEASSNCRSRTYVGVVEERNAANLSFVVAGTVSKIYVEEGDRVERGDLLMQLSSPNIEESLVAAEATYNQAQDGYQRAEMLYTNRSMPEIDFVDAQTKLQQAKSSLKIAQKNVDYTYLRAPYGGVVGRRIATVGEVMLPSLPVMTLLELDDLAVKVSIPEGEISTTQIGSAAVVSVGALDGARFEGSVASRGVVADPLSHTYEAVVAIDNKGCSNLLPGMIANVAIELSDESDITIPNRAVAIGRGDNRYVWVVEDGRAARRGVEVSGLSRDGVVVGDGLSVGDEVIVGGYQKVSVGSKVEVVR
ncbi:MAG: efflux RND transporter periplasmic adaptor subunit [Rikenellaceae bacterium]